MKGIHTLEETFRIDLRRKRAEALTYAITAALREYLPEDAAKLCEAQGALFELLHDKGVEVITDEDRASAGLPPRDECGLSAGELMSIELARLDRLKVPFMPLGEQPYTGPDVKVKTDSTGWQTALWPDTGRPK